MEELKVLGKVVGCVMGEDFNAIRVWENISGQKKKGRGMWWYNNNNNF